MQSGQCCDLCIVVGAGFTVAGLLRKFYQGEGPLKGYGYRDSDIKLGCAIWCFTAVCVSLNAPHLETPLGATNTHVSKL